MNTNNRIERLIKVGVSSDQIEKVGNEFPQGQPDLDLERFVIEESSGQVLIPLSKVKHAINRVNEGLSWLDNFIDNNEYRQGDEGSFEELLNSLEKRGISDFIRSFQVDQDDPITAIYYEDFDIYVIGEGKHRSTFAKIIGMDKIKAKVTTYKSNPTEKQKLLDYQNKRKALVKSIHNLNLELDIERAKIGLYKGEKINVLYGQKSIVKLDVIDSYYLDNGKMEINIKVMHEVAEFINRINKLPFFRNLIANLTSDNKNYHTLTRLILERLIKHGYFKTK